ncbi:MAG TPA: regulatory signaling modulator protein AmpE [Gammaproteobacteria bacterium]|jgi:membrane protein required for beta-lactamase induction
MSFLAALSALLLDQVLRHLEPVRDARWFRAYSETFTTLVHSPDPARATAGALLIVLVPAVVTIVLGDLLTHIWEGFGFLFAAAVFWFCLGPRDLHAQGQSYIDAVQTGDEARATAVAAEILDAAPPAAPTERTQAVTQRVFREANARQFGVLFWFSILGPGGAVLYRCTDFLKRRPVPGETVEAGATVARLLGMLDWIPAHLTALGYALAGSFEDAVSDLKAYYQGCTLHFFQVSDDVLVFSGLGAVRGAVGEETGITRLKSALGLVRRTLIIWLVIYGLFSIFSWSW